MSDIMCANGCGNDCSYAICHECERKRDARVAELEAALRTVAERQREACARAFLSGTHEDDVDAWAAAKVRATPLVGERDPDVGMAGLKGEP